MKASWLRPGFVRAVAMAVVMAICVCGIAPAWAVTSATQPITRTLLERRPIPGTDQEMQLILVVFQPGAASPLHHHPVAGLSYIIEGTAESAYGNDPPKLYHTGDTLQDLANVPHTIFRNPDQRKPLRFLIFTNLRADQSYLIVP